MTRRPAIFLDIDGVLYTGRSYRTHRFCPEALVALRWLVTATRAVIVLSSTWRKMSPKMLAEELRARGLDLPVHGKTPTLPQRASRADEIRAWLADDAVKHGGVERPFVVLDDDAVEIGPRLVLCDFETGLTQALGERAAEILAGGG